MASFATTFFFFLLLVLFSSLQIQARESKFFSKFKHTSTNKKISESKAPAPSTLVTAVPTPAPAPAPAFAPTENENSYGLYGNVGSKEFTPAKGTGTTVTDESDLLNEELSAENYEKRNQNSNYNNNFYTSNDNNNGYTNNKGYTTVNYNNNGYSNNFNTNGYETEKQGMSDTRFMDNYQTNNYKNNEYSNNNGYTNNYNYNGYSSNYNAKGYETDEKQGMSDTRYYLNGNYYDVQNEKYPPGYDSERQTEGKYGNTQNVNEFNTMEEYENQQVYQENYVP